MRFVCDSCRAQYMISDDKVGAKGVKVRCKKCGYVILVRKADSDATQVAQLPQGRDSDSTGPNQLPPEPGTRPGGDSDERPALNGSYANGHGAENGHGGNGVLSGADDDEIGAVFDQVLKSGPQKIESGRDQSEDVPLGFDDNDDLNSTRVVSADALRRLAQESVGGKNRGGEQANGENGAAGEEHPPAEKPNGVPETDWFVAVEDEQRGPLTLEKLKDLWDRGEVGPDSLCWRAGYSDWTALAEVADLKSVLAPKSSKPMISSSPALVGPASGAVVTVPVETSFNSGGMSQSVRTEMPVSMAAAPEGEAPAADTGGWQPSAASALASLVKEEMSALSRPSARSLLGDSESHDSPAGRGGGFLDLPSSSSGSAPPGANGHASNGLLDVPNPSGGAPSHAPASASASPYPSYTPAPAHSGMSRGLMVAFGGVAVLLVALIGTVLFVFTRSPAAPAAPAPVQVAKADVPTPAPAGASQTAPAPAPTTPAVAAAPAAAPPAEAAAPPAVAAAAPAPGPTAVPTPAPAPRHRGSGSAFSGAAAANTPLQKPGGGGDEADVITPRGAKGATGTGGAKDDDDFDSLFGKPGGKTPAAPAPEAKKKTVYVPGEAGAGGDVKESLQTSDVMQVVLGNKPKIVECVQQQKAKQPGLSGKLVMKWTVLPSGKTSAVTVQSEDLKSTYMANCITILIKGMSFPKHKVQGEPIVFPFTF